VEDRKKIRNTDITFYDYAQTWRKVYKATKANKTKQMYRNIVEKHLIELDGIRLQDIGRIHLQIVLNNASGMARTQQQIYMTFKQIIKSAVVDRLFPANVMEDIFSNIDSIEYNPEENRPLTEYEKKAIFSCDLKEQDKVFVYILYGCGLRRGEVIALTKFDFNLRKKELTVNKAADVSENTPMQKAPKSHNGYRTAPIPNKVFPTIAKFVKKNSGTHLFLMRNGKQMSKSSYDKMWARVRKSMQAACEDDEIQGLTAHVFRHNYCTSLCYQIPKISIKMIAYLLGDTEEMVLKVYNHMILEKEDAVGAVASALNF